MEYRMGLSRRAKHLRLRALTEGQTDRIHKTALRTLGEVGLDVQDEDTRKRLKDAGCREGEDRYVLFPEDVVEESVSTVPPAMVIYDQNGHVAVDTDDAVPRFSPGSGCIEVLDYKTETHRPVVLQDILETARLCDRLSNIDLVASLGSPSDVPPHEEALATARAIVENTPKPFDFLGHDENETGRVWQYLADVAGGWEHFSARPFAIDLTGATSPLKLGDEACRRLRFAASKRLPVICFPAVMPGATAPITLSGALAQAAAEILAGIVVHQLEGPGAPVVSGAAIIPLDMRTGNICYGSPEYALICQATVDYLRDRGIPAWSGSGCSEAHTVDAQAAAEAGMNIIVSVLAETSWTHNLGFLSSGKTGSLEMLLLCDELAGMASRIAAGVTVDEEALAFDVIQRVGKTGAFIAEDHTLEHARTEMWMPALFQRMSRPQWGESGGRTMHQRLKEKLTDLLHD
jgi:trimethylamine--corrinoid protein Co-methyltransferase